jgi:ankyrin repeat protein
MMAAEAGKSDAVRLLLKNGANVNARMEGGETVLRWATIDERANRKEIVRILKDAGAK